MPPYSKKISFSPFGVVLLACVCGGVAGYLMLPLIPEAWMPGVVFGLTLLSVPFGVRVLMLVDRIRTADHNMAELIAQTVELYLPSAHAYDKYVSQHTSRPIPDGATQIVAAIAETVRDMGRAQPDRAAQRLRWVEQLARGEAPPRPRPRAVPSPPVH